MKVMVFVRSNDKIESGAMPDPELISTMQKCNEELLKAGVLLDLNGLHPSSRGKRIAFQGGKKVLVDGPFAESKELVAGYWLLQTRSLEEAIAWFERAPMLEGDVLEVRQVFDLDDFALSDEQRAELERMGQQLQR